jgi:glycosyltransferase involved in cell wall biosynthesis
LKQEGIDVDVCCTGPRGALDEEFEAQGSTIWRIPKSANCRATARHLARLLTRRDYAIVHSRFGHASGGFALGAARMRVPAIISFHSAEPLSLYRWRRTPLLAQVRRGWLAWHRQLMARYATLFVGHSVANLSAVQPHWRDDPQRYRVVHNGIDFPDNYPSKAAARRALALGAEPVLLHVGTLKQEKNHTGLLQILRRVAERLPAVRLLLVGDGPERRRVEQAAAAMGLAARVRFEGSQRSLAGYYAAADAFVFPSVTEGFGNVLVESQAAGLPVVASDIPAHHESVAPPQHRFLFRLPDYAVAADRLVEQIEATRAGDNPWVAASKTHVRERFSARQFAQQLAQLYHEVAA